MLEGPGTRPKELLFDRCLRTGRTTMEPEKSTIGYLGDISSRRYFL